jgi:hypothetical protein
MIIYFDQSRRVIAHETNDDRDSKSIDSDRIDFDRLSRDRASTKEKGNCNQLRMIRFGNQSIGQSNPVN